MTTSTKWTALFHGSRIPEVRSYFAPTYREINEKAPSTPKPTFNPADFILAVCISPVSLGNLVDDSEIDGVIWLNFLHDDGKVFQESGTHVG